METMTELVATAVADYKAERDEAVAECERLNERVRVLEAALEELVLLDSSAVAVYPEWRGDWKVAILKARAALKVTK